MSERQSEKAVRFQALHEGRPFLVPNPWDAGSARVLEALGFEALASSSSALAFTFGRLDGEATLDEVVDHVSAVDAATALPLSVDLENGYGPEPEDAARAIERAAAAGAVGGSIEDFDAAEGLYDLDRAVERVAAAAEAARRLGFPFVFTARAENHIRGNPDLDDTVARLRAYEAAGADVLYAPGLRNVEEIRTVCEAGRPSRQRACPSWAEDGGDSRGRGTTRQCRRQPRLGRAGGDGRGGRVDARPGRFLVPGRLGSDQGVARGLSPSH